MSSMQVTVIGGSGFLGSAVVRTLLSRGWCVRVAARHVEHTNLGAHRGDSLTAVRCDVRDEAALERAFEGARAVVNAVGLYVEAGTDTFAAVHVEGAARAARCAARAGIERLVHVSGIGASSVSPSSYVRARAEGERRVGAEHAGAIIVRPSVLFGPGDAFLRAIDRMSRWSPVFPLFGRGATRMQPVYVGDVAAAVAGLVEDARGRAQLYELGGKQVLTYRQIVEAVLAHRGRRRALLPVPFGLWMLQARLLSMLPSPPLSVHQVILMRDDNVVREGAAGLADLGIVAGDLVALLPAVMDGHVGEAPLG